MLSTEQKKKYHNEVLKLGIHSSLQELFSIFANMLNGVMLSTIPVVGQVYLSATTLAGQYVMVYTYTALGLFLAVLMLLTQYFGKNDMESINKIFHTSYLFSAIISIIFFIIGFFFNVQVMTILTNDAEIIKAGAEYLKYYSFFFLFASFTKIYMTLLKSMGTVRIITCISVISIIFNFLISFVLIFGFITNKPLGTMGAGIASASASAVEFLLFFLHCTFVGKVKFSITNLFKIDFYFAKELFRYSIPNIICKFAWSTANAILISYVGHMSRDIINAFSFMKLYSNFPNAIVQGFGIAFGTLIGHELGKGNVKLAKEYGDDGLRYSIKTAIVTVIMTIGIGLIAMKVSNIPTISYPMYIYIAVLFAYQFFAGTFINYLNMGPFTAGGEVEFLALVDIVNMWVIMVPIGALLCNVLKIPEYISLIFILSSEYTKLLPSLSHYKKYVWARDLTVNKWFLPIAGSFIDKYKRNFKLRLNISLTEFFTKRFENTTDFIFSISKENQSKALEDLQNYLEKIELDKTTAYKTVLAMEEIFTCSDADNADIGVKLKDNKIRFIYYDNGKELKNAITDKSKENIQMLSAIADKLEYKKVLNLNKVLVRIDRK